ncbi:hypothetical protein [Streptomyces sp. NBC_01483]|uniref:hypothetical protein n=1 Tax=Streptomyces sp. NBC_01483 TaxID=2903883 RepID=UPI002E31271D|nr:hypothetical protein [Streptomyces sp. NBC_01483]
MAVTSYSPLPEAIPDPVTFKEASAMFAETGHPIHANTLVRQVRARKDIPVVRVGRTDYVSYSDALDVHAEWVRAADD